ncbi:hypothetical protein OIU76_018233 [Salix suchowensis]|nr:hypothetical protein OIU76_018233 [Salix suchowensis]
MSPPFQIQTLGLLSLAPTLQPIPGEYIGEYLAEQLPEDMIVEIPCRLPAKPPPQPVLRASCSNPKLFVLGYFAGHARYPDVHDCVGETDGFECFSAARHIFFRLSF